VNVDEVVDELAAESLKGETLRNRIPRGNARIFGPRGPKAIGRAGSRRRHFLPEPIHGILDPIHEPRSALLAETAKYAEHAANSLDYASFRLRSLTPHMGAEVLDLDLANPLDAQQSLDLDEAFCDWEVLVFRDQAISRDQHKAFGRRFGTLHTHPIHKVGARGKDPEILPVITTQDSAGRNLQ
jgi:hypothetical protein